MSTPAVQQLRNAADEYTEALANKARAQRELDLAEELLLAPRVKRRLAAKVTADQVSRVLAASILGVTPGRVSQMIAE